MIIQVLVDESFEIPNTYQFSLDRSTKVVFSPLTTKIAEEDYKLIISNRKHLKGLFGYLDNCWWPSNRLTEENNYRMLKWHEQQFSKRESFAYSIFCDDEYIGCFYIYGSNVVGRIVENPTSNSVYIFMFTTEQCYDNGNDMRIFKELKKWISKKWDFSKIEYPGRETPLVSFNRNTARWIKTKHNSCT